MLLGILVQNRRDTVATRRFLRSPLKNTGAVPQVPVTDNRSHGAAHREVTPSVEHRSHERPRQQDGEQPPAGPAA